MQIKDGKIHVQQGDALAADMVLYADLLTYLGLLRGQIQPDEALSNGLIQIEGDPKALFRFLKLCAVPDLQHLSQQ